MRRFPGWFAAFCLAAASLAPGVAQSRPQGYWSVAGGDAGHNNWQKAETEISTNSIAKGEFKFLWKIKLGDESSQSQSFSEPLLIPGLITGRGFKDMALWGDSHTLYSVDSELGTLIWQKDFKLQSPRAQGACGMSNLQIVMEPPRIIHFGAHRAPTPHPSASAPPPAPPAPATRRLGSAPKAGYFSLKGIYVLTGDGYLHEQILATGLDYAPAVRFLPAPNGNPSGLNMADQLLYTATGRGCRSVPNAAWSIDLSTPQYTVNSYKSRKVSLHGLAGPAIGADGTAYILAGSGRSDPSAELYANSVVALTKDMKVKDWYSPTGLSGPSDHGGKNMALNATPLVFPYKDKELIAAPGKDGRIVLLDSGSLGGGDHHTPLAQTGRITKSGAWEGLASWQDHAGTFWVLASISGVVERDVKFAHTNGPAPDGSIVAFKVEEKDGQPVLTPDWISGNMTNPAPPAIANGVVFALSGGNASTHATLYALDAATGKQLYSSGDAIGAYTHLAGMSVGDGHVFFVTHDNTLYSFGIPMEH